MAPSSVASSSSSSAVLWLVRLAVALWCCFSSSSSTSSSTRVVVTAAALTPAPAAESRPESAVGRRTFLGVAAAATAAGWNIVPAVATTTTAPQTGAKAPFFELPNSRGEGETSLDQLVQSKKWTVLYFYPGAFSQGCTLEARNFQRDMDQYRALNAQIVGVSVDPPEKNAQFCSAEGLNFFMLSDRGGAVSRLYGSALSVPGFGTFSNRQTYVIDPNGNLRWVFTDVESRIPRHSGEVLEKLSELTGTTNALAV